jgi:hypothetical protein
MAGGKQDRRRAKSTLKEFQKSLKHVNDAVEFNNKLHELSDLVAQHSNVLTENSATHCIKYLG